MRQSHCLGARGPCPALTSSGVQLTGVTSSSVGTEIDGTLAMILPAGGDGAYFLVAQVGERQQRRTWTEGDLTPIRTPLISALLDVQPSTSSEAIERIFGKGNRLRQGEPQRACCRCFDRKCQSCVAPTLK